MLVLVINSGSSSLKYQLRELADDGTDAPVPVLAQGLVERIGEETGAITHKHGEERTEITEPVPDHGYGLSRRRVTVSTSGVVPMIDRLRDDVPVALAVSGALLNVPPALRVAGRTLGAGSLGLMLRVLLPASVPSILTGLRTAWSFAWRALVGGELLISGASRKMALSAPSGITGSFSTNLKKSAKDCSRPNGPTTFGPRRSCTPAQILRSA